MGRCPGVVANPTSLKIDSLTILHGVQPTIFRANSSLLRTNDTEAAWEMVGWASYKLEGRGRKQALNQPQTPALQPTHSTLPNQAPRQLARNKTRRNCSSKTKNIFIAPDGNQTILVWHALAPEQWHIRNTGPELEALASCSAPRKTEMNPKFIDITPRSSRRARRYSGCDGFGGVAMRRLG